MQLALLFLLAQLPTFAKAAVVFAIMLSINKLLLLPLSSSRLLLLALVAILLSTLI